MPAQPGPDAGPPRPPPTPSAADIRRWRALLAAERAEGAVYRDLAQRRSGEEREILLALAAAEGRHEQHWKSLLGDEVGRPQRVDLRTRVLAVLARRFGSVFVLALAQRAEARSPYETEADATPAMAADERVHEEVVRSLATRGRSQLAGSFRAAVFGANDGLVSNLALVLGVSAAGAANRTLLITGLAGLFAGALSMGAGEYVSVRSQRELLEISAPNPDTSRLLPDLDLNANELALVYRARGLPEDQAQQRAASRLANLGLHGGVDDHLPPIADQLEAVGTGIGAALSSFVFFASGALIPVLPYLLGLEDRPALIVATALVGLALMVTGAIVGLLSGGPPLRRALRQLAIGFGAAAITTGLGLLLG